jgi:2'-hydroxyisoflavone reductase
MKKLLILGGTMFVGRALTEKLLAGGKYDITLFNRGKSNANLFPSIKQITGNRETDEIEQVYKENWDCIIDFSAYYPITFEKHIAALKGKVKRYLFISTISVFDIGKLAGKVITEDDETYACSEAQKGSRLPDAYGEKKAEMERILLKNDWLDSIIFRPSFIYGKYDWTERFYYWLYRAKFNEQILMPEPLFNTRLSNQDDLVEGLVQAIEIENHQSVYNTVSQPSMTLSEMTLAVAQQLNKEPKLVTIKQEQFEKLNIKQGDFPLYIPIAFKVDDSLFKKDFPFQRADMVGSLVELLDFKGQSGFPKPGVGLDLEREKEIIAAL